MPTLTPEQIAFVAASPEGGGFTGQTLVESVAIALAESRGDPDVVSPPNADQWGSRDRGLWQINDHWHADLLSRYTWSNPFANAKMARLIRDDAGGSWEPWATWPGRAGEHLARARQAVSAPVPPPGASDPGGTVTDPAVITTNPISQGLDAIRGQLGRIASLFDALLWLTRPDNIRRVLVGTAGAAFLLVGIGLLGRVAWQSAPKGATS